tara:strand:- start:3139 stop:3963 length:825 start_codon:yes stop_codon:yes gene_type:complete
MAKFKQEQIIPGVTKTRTNAVKVYCSEAIAAGDIISVVGMQDDFMSVAKADANGAVTLNNSLLFVADFAGGSGEYLPLALPWKVVTGINTASGTIGDPLYLSDTAGSVSLTGSIKVGTVLTVAASGTAIIAPGAMVANSGAAKGGLISLVGSGAQDYTASLTQPAGTVLTDFGAVLTTAIAGSSGNVKVKLGTADDGAQLVALTDIMSGATSAPIGTGVCISNGAQSEGDASATWVADSPLYTAAARTIFFRTECSATITAGVIAPWINFEYVG